MGWRCFPYHRAQKTKCEAIAEAITTLQIPEFYQMI